MGPSEKPSETIESLQRTAEVQRREHQPDLALATLVKALELRPDDVALHRLAEEVAVEADAVDVLVELLGDLADNVEGPSRAALHKQLAGLHARHFPETGAAVEHLQKALEDRPEDLEALEALRRQLEKKEGWAALAEVTEKIARLGFDRDRQLAAWKAAAALHETRLHDEESALECWLHVLELSDDGEKPEAAGQVRRLLAAVPGHEKARAALDRLAPPPPPSPPPPPETSTKDLLDALQAFVMPGADRVKALPGLRHIAQQVDALDSLAEVVEAESDKIEDPAELTALLRFVALLREELKQPRQAIVVWNDLLAVQPNDLEALEHLHGLLTAAGESKNAAEVALRLARLSPGPDQLARIVKAADVLLAAGSLERDPERTALVVEAYAQAVRVRELEREAVAGLERLLAVPAARAAAGAALEAPLRRVGDPRRLVEALEAQVETGDASNRRLRLIEIAKLWEQANEPRAALGAQVRAFLLAPSNARLRADLERLAASLDAKDELLAAYEEGLDREPKGEAAARWRRVAELRQELKAPGARVLEAWEKAAEAAPGDADLLSAHAAACRAQGDLPRLARALRLQINALPGSPARTELLYELADLCDDSLADTAGAVRAYQELLSQAPEDRAVLKSLQRLYERTKDSMGLEDVLARDLELARKAGAGPEEVSALALRLGLLKLERPEEGAAALALLSEVLRLEPHQPHALAALGKLASTPGPLQQEAARLATPAMGKLGDFQAVVQVLEAQLSTQAGPAERAAILRRLADLHEGPLDDPDLAFLAVTRALRETPQDASLLLRSVALAEVTGAQEDLEALLEDLATSQPPGAARAELWRALARSLDGRSQPAEALRAWSQVRMESPGDPEATGRLAASLEQAGRFKELTDLVQQQVDSASPEQRPAALARLAAAREKAGLLEEAVSTLHSLFALTQGADALRSLERILGKLGRHPERAEVLKRLTALATAGGDPKERVDLLLRQARAQLQAGQPELAVATLADLLAASPDEPRAIPELITLAAEPRARATALDLLESAFKDPKQGFQRVAILELLVEARSPEDSRALRAELAALHETLGDLRQAFAWRLRLLAESPGEQGARVEAERLARAAHMEEELAGAYQDLLERKPPVDLHLDAADRGLPILEGVLESAGRFDLLGELLAGHTRAARAAGDEMLELDLTVREARLRLRALKDGASALSLLASVLQRRDGLPEAIEGLEEIMRSEGPVAHQAAEMLERHYRRAGSPQQLVEALEVRARAAAGQWAPGEEQAGLLLQIADLHERTLKAPAVAFDALARLLRLQPDDGPVLERILALAGPANAEPALEALLAETAPRAAKPETRMAILRPLARLRERLGDPAGALEGWQELLAFRPDDAEALASASTLLEAASRWDELLVVLERRLTLAQDDDERAALLGRIGSLRADALGDAEGAHGVLWSLLRLRPGDRRTLAQLDPICQELEKWPELADVLERRLRVEPDRRVELLLRLAQVRRTRLGDPAGALPLLGEALQAQPGHAGALAELERLVKESPGMAPAEDLLLDTYRRARDLPRLIPLLEACSERAQEQQRRRALWQELADLRLKQEGDPERAFLALARAYRESPADAALRAKLIEVAQAAGALEELVTLLEEVVGRLAPPDAAEVSLVMAGLCEGPGGEPERAVALYRRAIELAPQGAARVWPRLDRALESLERWEELLPVVEAQERAAGDGPERVGLLLRIATLAAERLALPERAMEAYRAVLQKTPNHLGAARALEALYEQHGQRERLLEILDHLNLHAPAEQRPAIRLKLARLSAAADPARAEALCRQLLAGDPLHAEAFALLSDLLEGAGRHEDLERLLLARLAATTAAPEAAADLEHRLAELTYRQLKRPQPAAARYRAVLERRPRHLGALVALSEIYEAPATRRELSQVLGRLAQVQEDPKLRRKCHLRHAEVLAELGDRHQALAAARQALELVPDDEAEIGRLRVLLLAQGALPEAAKALGLAAALQLDAGRTADAVTTLFELAEIEGRRKDAVAGAAALETILVHQPANRRAYDLARALYTGAKEWPALATLLGRFLPNLEAAERLTTLDELADVCESKLSDAIDAFGWAKQAMLLDPGSAPRRERLERLARALRRPEELASVYRQVLAGPEGAPTAVFIPISLALAAVEDRDLDQADGAEKTLRDLLTREPGHAAAIDALVQMFSRRGLHRKLAEALELKLESPSGQAVRVQVLQQLAELHETRLDDLAAAAGALQRRFDARRDVGSAELMVAFHRRHEQWKEALGALLLVRDLVTTPKARAQAQFDVAELYERELADPESAVAAYLEALKHDPASPESFQALERLYRQLDRPAELLRAYSQRLPHVDRDAKVEILFRSAELWERRGSPLEADRCLESVLQLRPGEVKAMEELARLRRAGSRWRPLTDILARHVGVATQPETRAALCTELGEVSLLHLKDGKGAERWWRTALDHLPTHRPALGALADLDQKEGRWTHAAELIEREANLEEDASTRAELLHRAGAIREERLGDLVGARRTYGQALKADQDHWPSLRRLRALYLQAKSWPEYEQNLAHEARRAPSAPERCDAAVELAAHHERTQDFRNAIDWYRYALEQQPGALAVSLPLSDLLLGTQQWAEAAEVLEGAVQRLEEGGAEGKAELVRRLYQLGLARHQLRRTGPAIEAYGRALELDPANPDALRGQFQLLEESGRHAEAADTLQTFLDLHGRELATPEQLELGVRLGEMCRMLGRAAQARAAAERALQMAPTHPGALRVLVAACDQLSAFDRAVGYRQQLAAVVGPDERYQLLFDLGEMAHRKLSDPKKAIDGYLGALQVRPGSLEVLQRLPTAYRDSGQDRKAAEALQALLQHPDLPRDEWRRQTLVLAELLGRMPSGLDRAVEVLEAAFERDPAFADAIKALETLLGRARQWKRLDGCYERAIRRMGDSPEVAPAQAALWRAAGELRLREIRDRAAALAAFEAGARLMPDDPVAQETFADLAMEFPPRAQAALAAYRRALPATAHPEKICAAATQVAEWSNDPDLAFLAARAAQLLAAPSVAQAAALDRLTPLVQTPPELRVPVSDDSWRQLLVHPDARGPLGDLMALLFGWAGKEYGANLGDFKLHPKKHAVDLGTVTHPALRHLVTVSRALGFQSLTVLSTFLAVQTSGQRMAHPDDAAGLRVIPTVPFTLVVGQKFLSGADRPALSAIIGHALAQLRPELAMTLVLEPEQLALVIDAALGLVDEGHVSRADPKALKAERKRVEKSIPSAGRGTFAGAVRAYARVAGPDDLARYLEGVRRSSLRAALLAAGDFGPVRHLLPAGPAGDTALRDLVGFALGGDLHALRRQTQSQLVSAPRGR